MLSEAEPAPRTTEDAYKRGLSAITSAVHADKCLRYQEALDLYAIGIELLLPCISACEDPERRRVLGERVAGYMDRAEALKAVLADSPLAAATSASDVLPPPAPQSLSVGSADNADGAGGAGGAAGGGAKILRGAAVAGTAAGLAAGLVVGAPIALAVAGAGGAAYAATRKDDVGRVAKQAGHQANRAIASADELNEKHNVTGKVKDAAKSAARATRAFNEKHDVTGRTARAAKNGWQQAKDFDERHDVRGKAAAAGRTVLDGAAKAAAAAQAYDRKHNLSGRAARAASDGAAAAGRLWNDIWAKSSSDSGGSSSSGDGRTTNSGAAAGGAAGGSSSKPDPW